MICKALSLGDRICIMKEGKVVQLDTPEGIIHNPKNEFVESSLEIMGELGMREKCSRCIAT